MRHEHGVPLRIDPPRTHGARWLALAAFAPASCDIVDDAGLVNALAGLDPAALLSIPLRTWAWLAYFGGLGAALGWLATRLRPSDRLVLWGAVAVLLSAHAIQAGFRGSSILAALTLWGAGAALVQERRYARGKPADPRAASTTICSPAPER